MTLTWGRRREGEGEQVGLGGLTLLTATQSRL